LKKQILRSEKEHKRIENNQKSEIIALREINEAVKQDMESQYNSKLIFEYDKYSASQQEKIDVIDEYENKLIKLAEAKDQILQKSSEEYADKIKTLELTIQKV